MSTLLGALLFLSILTLARRRLDTIASILAATVALALAPLPTFISDGVVLGGGTLYWADLGAGALIMLSIASLSRRYPELAVCVLFALFLITVFALVGLLQGADLPATFRDLRGPLRLVAAASAVTSILWTAGASPLLRMFPLLFASIALASGLAVVTVFLTGSSIYDLRTEEVSLYSAGVNSAFGATRVTPQSGLMCALFLALMLALVAKGRSTQLRRLFAITAMAASALVLVAGYTRGHFLVFGIVLLSSLAFIPRNPSSAGRHTRLALAAALTLSVGTVALSGSAGLRTAVLEMLEGFSGRVLNGLNPTVVATDSSVRWRDREAEQAVSAFFERPAWGTGFGLPYRSHLYLEIFNGNDGLTYIHNSYLWVLVKCGVVGLVTVAITALVLAARLVATSSLKAAWPARVCVGVTAALAIQSYISPTPFESANSLVVGILVAISAWLPVHYRPRRTQRQHRPLRSANLQASLST